MAHYLFPGAAAQGYEPLRQDDPPAGQSIDEKALPHDWQVEVAAARRRLRRRRILFGAAAVSMLLAPFALMSILGRPHYFDRYQYDYDVPDIGSLSDVASGQLSPWLARLGGHHDVDSALGSGSSPPATCHKTHVPWSGNGRYYINTEDLSQIELLVKAHYIDTKLTVTRAPDAKDQDGRSTSAVADDEDEDKVYIDAQVFFSQEKLQDSIKLTEEREGKHYAWRIEPVHGLPHHDPPHHDPPHHDPPHHGPPHHGPPHQWWPRGHGHDGKHRLCGRGHVHIHLPKSFTDLDALHLGLAVGKIYTEGLEHVQFGQFKAGLFRGFLHVGNVNAVQVLEVGAIHGDVALYRSQSHAVLVGSATGNLHVTDIEAQKVVRARTTSGEIILATTKAPVVVVGTVSGRATTSDTVEADRLIAGSVSGEVKLHGTVTHALRARTVSGTIDAAFDYKPTSDDDDDDDDNDDEDEDDLEGYELSTVGERADISLAAVSGAIRLRLEDYVGRFSARSTFGQVEVQGDKVHLERDTEHHKVGYVHDDGNRDDTPRIAAGAVSGSISLTFV